MNALDEVWIVPPPIVTECVPGHNAGTIPLNQSLKARCPRFSSLLTAPPGRGRLRRMLRMLQNQISLSVTDSAAVKVVALP